ncbi:MAG: hypothetical protein R3C14_01110 [Caldilineaceae bacterium]
MKIYRTTALLSKWVLFLGIAVLIAGLIWLAGVRRAHSQQAAVESRTAAELTGLTTTITYQGRLQSGTTPANGTYDFEFTLYDVESDGKAVAAPVAANGVTVTDGVFSVPLDFGNAAFPGEPRWLEIKVRPSGSGNFGLLTPRQFIAPVPYAIYATAAGTAASASRATTANSATTADTATKAMSAESADAVAWNKITGMPADFADGVDNTTELIPGTGLTLVDGKLTVDFGGSGNAATVAHSDHLHVGQTWTTTASGLQVTSSGATEFNHYGVAGYTSSPFAGGIYGQNDAANIVNTSTAKGFAPALFGVSNTASGRGVEGQADATSGSGYGVAGFSGSAAGSGVYGENMTTTGKGVEGFAGHQSGLNVGVYGLTRSTVGSGVEGHATAASGLNAGVAGFTASSDGYAIYGENNATDITNGCCAIGVFGISNATDGTAVQGEARATSGASYGVLGFSKSAKGVGVYGQNDARASGGYAGYFLGPVHVNGTLTKSSGAFKIDHPLDPANQYLSHSFVESPDMMNIYNGNLILDDLGEGWVQLPDYFEALNVEFRYQLTPIGAPGPNLYVAQEIVNNQFKIAGGQAGMKVSWQVTGIRNDPYARAHPIVVEEDKPVGEQGLYLNPAEYGQSEARMLNSQSDRFESLERPADSPPQATESQASQSQPGQ